MILFRPSFPITQEDITIPPTNVSYSVVSVMSVLTCISLAASGDLEGLEIWSLAGADLTTPGYDGQTAIQVVGIGARSRSLR